MIIVKKFLTIVLSIMLIFMFSVIFGFSNQNADKSLGLSTKITEFITKPIKSIQNLSEKEKKKVLDKINKIVRKIAHFSLYMLVGIISMSLMVVSKIDKLKVKIALSFAIGMVYAISDEIHQMFVEGRTPLVGDVFIDSFRCNSWNYNCIKYI